MVYVTYADVEKALQCSFDTTHWPTQTHVTNTITHVEKLAAGRIYPATLADASTNNSDALVGLLVELVIAQLNEGDKYRRAKGALGSESERGVPFPESVRDRKDILADLKNLAEGSTIMATAELIRDDSYD